MNMHNDDSTTPFAWSARDLVFAEAAEHGEPLTYGEGKIYHRPFDPRAGNEWTPIGTISTRTRESQASSARRRDQHNERQNQRSMMRFWFTIAAIDVAIGVLLALLIWH